MRGSHKWVAEKIASHQLHDIRHLQLNSRPATVTNATASDVSNVILQREKRELYGNLGKIQQVAGKL